MDNGWIKIHRKLLDWEWFDNPSMLKVWLWLLFSANHEDKRWQGRLIKRGQKLTSIRHISESLRMGKDTVLKSLRKLKKTGEIDYKGDRQNGTLITIMKYNEYQVIEDSRVSDIGTQVGTRIGTQVGTQLSTQVGTQAGTKQELKELKNTLLPPRAREESIDKVKILKGYLADDDFIFGKSEEVMMPYERVKDCISMFLSQIQNNPDTDDSTSETELQRHMTNWMRNNKRINQSSKNKNNGSTKPTISFAERIEQLRQQTQAELDELGTITAH